MPPAGQKRRDIKAGNDPTDLRRRRADDNLISLRKQKKEQGLAKRRNTISTMTAPVVPTAVKDDAAAPVSTSSAPGATNQCPFTAADVPQLAEAVRKAQGAERVEAARGLRKVLSLETEPPVSEVIESGVVPWLVACLDEHSNTELQVGISVKVNIIVIYIHIK